ncbi:MAG: hypothetical protein HUU06_09575, partial [Planctomycetaceae bacterium]|nr:hypothetical protein [Planctomycetaceae bacterium]
VNGLRPREVVQRAAAGDPGLADGPEPWKCVTCYACASQCRAGIDVAELFYELRNEAARRGRIPDAYRAVAKQVLASGCAFPVTRNTARMRQELGLPPFAVSPRGVEELNSLCRAAGLPDLDRHPEAPVDAGAPGKEA